MSISKVTNAKIVAQARVGTHTRERVMHANEIRDSVNGQCMRDMRVPCIGDGRDKTKRLVCRRQYEDAQSLPEKTNIMEPHYYGHPWDRAKVTLMGR